MCSTPKSSADTPPPPLSTIHEAGAGGDGTPAAAATGPAKRIPPPTLPKPKPRPPPKPGVSSEEGPGTTAGQIINGTGEQFQV